MDIELLVEEIMEAVTSEPEADYGDPKTDYWVRQRGIEARIHDVVQKFFDSVTLAYAEEAAGEDL